MALKRRCEELKLICAQLEELVTYLITAPEDKAQQALHQLRTNMDPFELLGIIKGEGLQPNPSELSTARAVLPNVQSDLELELLAKHPISYPTLDTNPQLHFPHVLGKHGKSQPQRLPDNRAPTQLPEWPIAGPLPLPGDSGSAGIRPSTTVLKEDVSRFTKCVEAGAQDTQQNLVEQAYRYCDPRLRQLNLSYWSTVQIEDTYAAAILSLHLEEDHALLGLFDSNVFISDLVSQSQAYCSSFLVNSMFAYACVGNVSS
jgi:hypothetical protein